MITRLVKLTLQPDKIDEFLEIFKEVKETIASFDGCHHVELLQDLHARNIFFTYSTWEDEHFLDHYRFSDFFKSTWTRSKLLFSDKAEAWSVGLIEKAQSAHF